MDSLLDVSTSDFVTTIRMNRPPVNALVPELQEQLIEALNRVKDQDATRVVVLTSAIDRYFMAGADIKAMGGDGGFDRENPATLGELATTAAMSRSHFSHTFHTVAGMALRDYVRDLRLQHAHRLILNSPLSLTDVAIDSGFYDLPHLDKAFRQRIGVSPQEYRSRYRSDRKRSTG